MIVIRKAKMSCGMSFPSGDITNLPLSYAWDMLRARVDSGATCVISVPVPASAEPPPGMMASLDGHELAAAARLQVAQARTLYIVTHHLLAQSVHAVTGVRRASWSFAPETPGGKPRLVVEHDTLHASLSHTKGAVAVAISRVAPVGVDVEAMAPLRELDLIADRMLTARERREVFASADALAMFTRLWTRKEAVAKAFGVGFRVPFDEIDVLVPATPLFPPALSGDVVLRDVQASGPVGLLNRFIDSLGLCT
jgi:4'-phosphopantetheinyl transferase